MTDTAELVKLADDLPTRLRGLVEDGQSALLSDALEEAADEIERLRAALAAQQDGAWQPIATAPKDMTPVLLYVVHPGDDYAKAVGEPNGWAYVEPGVFDGDWAHEHAGTPTHWRPLPAPPTI